jgi:thiamine biosynthesis lipoprotein ApbE
LFSSIEKYLRDFEEKYSRFQDNNWLAWLNRERCWTLDSDGKKMIKAMIEVARATEGYFDPTIWKRLAELWYGTSHLTDWKKNENYSYISLEENIIHLKWDIEIEFWGIGKWYLLDILYDKLIIAGYDEFLINFWWDLSARGEWKIGLENPFSLDEIIGTKIITDGFFACSAGTKRKWWNHHHLINPHTGNSSSEVVASYIEW